MPLARSRFHPEEAPPAKKLRFLQFEGERARCKALLRIALRLPDAAIPQQYDSGALVTWRDDAFEVGII